MNIPQTFAELLKSYCDAKEISVKEMSDYTGVNRLTLYKIINGSREPGSEEIVQKMTDFLCLNDRERERLVSSYYIAKWGRYQYYGRTASMDFFRDCVVPRERPQTFYPYAPVQIRKGERKILSGRTNVDAGIEWLLANICTRNKYCHIKIYEPFLRDRTVSMVEKLLEGEPFVTVTHCLTLDNGLEETDPQEDHLYNIHVLQELLPMVIRYPNYNACYGYSRITCERMSRHFLPNFILADGYVMEYSTDRETAVVTLDPDYYDLFSRQMEKTTQDTKRFCSSIDYASFCRRLINSNQLQRRNEAGPVYYFHSGIRMSAVMQTGEAYTRKHLADSFPRKEEFLQYYDRYLRLYNESYASVRAGIVELFTKQGVDAFVEEGYIGEIHPDICIPLNERERLEFLNRWIDTVRDNEIYMVDYPDYPKRSTLSAYATQNNTLIFLGDSDGYFRQAVVSEAGLSRMFYDFFEYLKTDYASAKEETLRYLVQKKEELQKRISTGSSSANSTRSKNAGQRGMGLFHGAPVYKKRLSTVVSENREAELVAYGTHRNVFLTREEHEDLVARLGSDLCKHGIRSLSEYLYQNESVVLGNHYETLLGEARADDII